MKSILKATISMAIIPVLLCSSCEKEETQKGPVYRPDFPTESFGAYLLFQGQYYNNVEGVLDYLSYSDNSLHTNLFTNANHRSLGDTPQCGLVYGSHIFLGVCFSNTIEVLDKSDLTSIKQFNLDSSTGTQPRAMVAKGGKVYISMYDGYVARLDTLTMTIDAKVAVGPNPEKLAIYRDALYVPNSDGMNSVFGTTASVIDLSSFTVTRTLEVPMNPNQFITVKDHLYLLSMGNYGMIPGQEYIPSEVYEITPDSPDASGNYYHYIAPATMIAASESQLYILDAPFSALNVNFSSYNPDSKELSPLTAEELVYPSGIGVDPITGNIIITSYVMDGAWPGYSIPGIILLYDNSCRLIKKFNGDIGPAHIFFDTK